MPAKSNVVVSEGQVTFKRVEGHKHDGITSSLIDTSKYSMFDFVASETSISAKQANNRDVLKRFIVSTIEGRFLSPEGIRLQANAITAREIVAGTITADELSSNIVLVNNVIRSNNFINNTGTYTGWAIYSNGTGIFNNIQIRGNLVAGTGVYANTNTPIFANIGGYFSLGSNFAWDGTTLTIKGALQFPDGSTPGTFDNGDALTGGSVGGITIGNSSIRSTDYDANPTTAGFAIYSDGTAIFNEVTVRGTIYAGGGEIGGWVIGPNSITGGSTALHSNGQITNGAFSVSSGGVLSATGVNISGAITATSGSISGTVTIGSQTATAVSGAVTTASSAAAAAAAAQATADSKINNTQVNGNVTSISGGVITTGTINLNNVNVRTGTTGARLNIDSSGIFLYNASGTNTVSLLSNGGASFSGFLFGATGSIGDSFSIGNNLTVGNNVRINGAAGDGAASVVKIRADDQGAGNPSNLGQYPLNVVSFANNVCLRVAYNARVDIGESGGVSSSLYIEGTFYTSSDARLKSNVTPTNLGLDFINKLRPVSYNLINEETTKNHYGFIAQDVKKVLEDLDADFGGWHLYDENDKESNQVLSYLEFISPLVKAIQELSAKNEELQTRIQALEGV